MHCETHSPSKKQCFNKDNGFIQGTSFVLVSSCASGVQYERGVVTFYNQYHQLNKDQKERQMLQGRK